jgi:hypothetical protein
LVLYTDGPDWRDSQSLLYTSFAATFGSGDVRRYRIRFNP